MIENLAIQKITEAGLPVYILGVVSDTGKMLIKILKDNNIHPVAIWDEDFLKVKYSEVNKNIRDDIYSSWSICVDPVPNNFAIYPKGIIFVAAPEKLQRNRLKYVKEHGGERHVIYDGFDVALFPVHRTCEKNNSDANNLLSKCRACKASYRSCPVRRNWYNEKTGKSLHYKVIRHIAIKVGYICNLRCNYCCEFLPHFTDSHIKKINPEEIMKDIQKMSDALEYIHIMSFSGGDVMLNKYISEILEFSAGINNIGNIYLLTNGTYIPHSSILDVIQKNKEHIRIVINNYALNKRAEPLINELNKRGINNHLRDNAGWYAFLDQNFKGRSIDELKHFYNFCSMDNNNGYYCVYESGKVSMRCGVASAILYFKNMYDMCKEDYIDLRKLPENEISGALTKLEDRGYLDICNFCPSSSVGNRTLQAAEEQLKKHGKNLEI